MILTIIKASGGLGIFLLGMIVMTEGLRSLAGDSIRNALMHFSRTPYSGAAAGAATTALLQSSSATTVAAVGFVGAGLLTFPQSLGIIFGANIGTTVTGWMVALFGFKFPLGMIVLPLILFGVMLRLFFKGKFASSGYALAGFGLIFVGISLLQEGMSGFEGIITPENLPSGSFLAILKLVALGIIATIITQSSSAGVATTLTALYAHAITFEQAAALVIGMDIGTTVTAAMAAIGGSVNVRRTGLSHVIYNLFTGAMAVFLIMPYIYLWQFFAADSLIENAEIALVAFHTLFNTIGVLLILPFTSRFAYFIEKLVPSKEPVYTEVLDMRLLEEPSLALEAARSSLQNEFIALLKHILFILGDKKNGRKADLPLLQTALDNTQSYVDLIDLKQEEDARWEQIIALIHILDHAQRLHERCEEDEERARVVERSDDLRQERDLLLRHTADIIDAISDKNFSKARKAGQENEASIQQAAAPYREKVTEMMAKDRISIHDGTTKLEAIRWLVRVSHHIARITFHMEKTILYTAK